MRKVQTPLIDHATALEKCLEGVGDPALLERYQEDLPDGNLVEADYLGHAQAATLYSLPRVSHQRGVDPIICGTLTKSNLTNLYSQYFVPETKPARRIYQRIKLASNGKCPLCGEIGHVRTLDHYLPKASFPLFSVLPGNLIPCCRDCNTEKLDAFSQTPGGQTLHPYFDADKYFVEKWVWARVHPGAPPLIEYLVTPPAGWTNDEKNRVVSHFDQYGLAERFSVEAGADLPETILTRRTTLSDHSPQEFSSYLLEKSNNIGLPINNWRRAMFACLAEDPWFCSHAH